MSEEFEGPKVVTRLVTEGKEDVRRDLHENEQAAADSQRRLEQLKQRAAASGLTAGQQAALQMHAQGAQLHLISQYTRIPQAELSQLFGTAAEPGGAKAGGGGGKPPWWSTYTDAAAQQPDEEGPSGWLAWRRRGRKKKTPWNRKRRAKAWHSQWSGRAAAFARKAGGRQAGSAVSAGLGAAGKSLQMGWPVAMAARSGLAAAAGAAGPVGVGVAVLAVAAVKAAEALNNLTKEQLAFNRSLGNASAQMAFVFAERDIQERMRNREKGDRLSDSARSLVAAEQFRSETGKEPELLWNKTKNYIGTAWNVIQAIDTKLSGIDGISHMINTFMEASGSEKAKNLAMDEWARETQRQDEEARKRKDPKWAPPKSG